MDWRTAYFMQAKSDFAIFQHLKDVEDIPLCQKLHYLQMATEKLSKGFLTLSEGGPHIRTHNAFQLFVRLARERREIRAACGFTDRTAFRAYIDSLMEKVALIENLSPEGDDHPNPEYPWQDPTGAVISPITYPFRELDINKDTKMIKLILFVERCLRVAQ